MKILKYIKLIAKFIRNKFSPKQENPSITQVIDEL